MESVNSQDAEDISILLVTNVVESFAGFFPHLGVMSVSQVSCIKHQQDIGYGRQYPSVDVVGPLYSGLSVLMRLEEELPLVDITTARIDYDEEIFPTVILLHKILNNV